MIIKAPAKINLGLHIKGKRNDGFHELESIFYSIPLFDYVELILSEQDSFSSYNIKIPGEENNNLCLLALRLLRDKGYNISNYHIHLLKNIPIGAGLGGGSSDAIAVLSGVNRMDNLQIPELRLAELAAELGSDCPFFCVDSASLVTGRGETITPISFSLKGKYLLLVNPGIHISSKEAYEALDLNKTTTSKINWNLPPSDWKHTWVNDFEQALHPNHPELQRIKNHLYVSGAFYASLSGSGSSVYGIFNERPENYLFESLNYSEWIFNL